MDCQPEVRHQVYQWLKNNHSCLLCNLDARQERPICIDCELDLPWLGEQCMVCALPLPVEGQICGECLRKPPSFERVEAAWRFRFPVDSLITQFKHQARWPYGRLLAELFTEHLQHSFAQGLPRPDYLLPVPLARKRLRQRGFNQAGMLADWLGKSLALPVAHGWLLRPLETPAQQQLDAATRKRNLRQAFQLDQGAQLKNRHIAVIDDVLTTGATAEAIARLLHKAGAARVDIYCLARTPRPGD
jgi:ComF family protein